MEAAVHRHSTFDEGLDYVARQDSWESNIELQPESGFCQRGLFSSGQHLLIFSSYILLAHSPAPYGADLNVVYMFGLAEVIP